MPTSTMLDSRLSTYDEPVCSTLTFERADVSSLSLSRLEQTRAELIDERVKSTDEKIFTESELANLRSR